MSLPLEGKRKNYLNHPAVVWPVGKPETIPSHPTQGHRGLAFW